MNFSVGSCEDVELNHLKHTQHKLLKEGGLVLRIAVNNVLRAGVAVEILVGRKESFSVLQINVILFVEYIWSAYV